MGQAKTNLFQVKHGYNRYTPPVSWPGAVCAPGCDRMAMMQNGEPPDQQPKLQWLISSV